LAFDIDQKLKNVPGFIFFKSRGFYFFIFRMGARSNTKVKNFVGERGKK
jgi:hypothetical protein